MVAAALLVGGLGFAFLQLSSASPFTGQREAEGGDIGGKAHIGVDDLASGRSKVNFGEGMAAQEGLHDPGKKEMAMQIVSSAENSSLDWRAQFKYLQDIGDGRGYTGGIIGFCSGTGDMLELVEHYTALKPGNVLAKYLPALRKVNGSDSHEGLGSAFENDWKTAAGDPLFQQSQEFERDRVYFDPAVNMAKADGVHTLGQFAYYDAAVMHGPDAWGGGLPDIRKAALQKAKPPIQGGDETVWLSAFLDARKAEMLREEAHSETDRVDFAQRKWLQEGNLGLEAPISWTMYGDQFSIKANP